MSESYSIRIYIVDLFCDCDFTILIRNVDLHFMIINYLPQAVSFFDSHYCYDFYINTSHQQSHCYLQYNLLTVIAVRSGVSDFLTLCCHC